MIKEFQPETVRKSIIAIKRFLKIVILIKLPSVPQKLKHIQELIKSVESLSQSWNLPLSHIRLKAEEIFSLIPRDIDVENRTILIKSSKT